MDSPPPITGASPAPPPLTRLERWGVQRLSTDAASADNAIEVLTADEQHALRRIQRVGVWRAAFAGALSAAVSGVAAVVMGNPDDNALRYWAVVGSVTAIASVLEIVYLYLDGLRAVRDMAACAGLRLDPDATHDEFTLVLARAALELPTPPTNVLEVDPHREANRVELLLVPLMYKAKIALTSFLLKAVLRRALGRAVARSALEFVAVPVTAIWNAVVAHWVLQEARLRIVGGSAVTELARWTNPSPASRQLCLHAVACVMVKARGVHPNVDKLAREFLDGSGAAHDVGDLAEQNLGDQTAFLEELRGANAEERLAALRALCAASIVDGRFTRRERRLLELCFGVCALPVPLEDLEKTRAHMVHGDGLRVDLLASVEERLRASGANNALTG